LAFRETSTGVRKRKLSNTKWSTTLLYKNQTIIKRYNNYGVPIRSYVIFYPFCPQNNQKNNIGSYTMYTLYNYYIGITPSTSF